MNAPSIDLLKLSSINWILLLFKCNSNFIQMEIPTILVAESILVKFILSTGFDDGFWLTNYKEILTFRKIYESTSQHIFRWRINFVRYFTYEVVGLGQKKRGHKKIRAEKEIVKKNWGKRKLWTKRLVQKNIFGLLCSVHQAWREKVQQTLLCNNQGRSSQPIGRY